MKTFLVFLLLRIVLFMNGGFFTLGQKQDANLMASDSAGSCVEKERQVLVIFKASLVDFSGHLDDWGGEKEKRDCCLWSGVYCNNQTGHVIAIDLSQKELSGSITTVSLGDLNFLTHLNLSSNNLTGNLPDSMCLLSNLCYLNVSYNSLNGSIHEFTGCSYMTTLDLSSNNFTGDLPTSVGRLLRLDYLDVSHNSFKGNIPDFTGCPSLSTLYLSSNDFTGNLPMSVSQLLNLEYLDVSHNALNGNIPDFTVCQSLSTLDLSDNNLSGHLPITVGQLLNLQYLDASSNSLNGVISDLHFQNLSQLTYLDLSFNSFSLDQLRYIPFQLETIKLQFCRLGPSFPFWLKTQSHFTHLDISSTGISETLPGWFWDLPDGLKYLNISSNKIRGMLPPNTTPDFIDYPGMDLSSNQFEGQISQFPSKMASLNLFGNNFSGNLTFLCHIDEALSFLHLSDNLFSGSLPDCWLKFHKSLIVLNLSNNNLSGEIPPSMGFLSHLQALYLRTNAFVGELPMSLSNCTKLRFIDLGENKLSGLIPEWLGERVTELYVLVLRSNRFYGSLPTQICWLYNLQLLDLSKNQLSGNVPRCFGNFSAMAMTRSRDDMTNHSYFSYVTGTGTAYMRKLPSIVVRRPREHHLNSGVGVLCFKTGCKEEGLFIDNAWVAWKGTRRSFGRSGLQLLKSIDLSSNNLSGKIPYEIASLFELISLNLSTNKLQGEVPKEMGQLKYLESLDLSRNEFSGHIPWSQSRLTFLSYLDLSENNLSGSIPTGFQLQRFNSSSYNGNLHLCGVPLTQRCELRPPTTATKNEEDESEVSKWYYTGMGVGFAVGFWGISGVISLNRGCRNFLFASLSHVNDWIHITMAVYLRKLKGFN